MGFQDSKPAIGTCWKLLGSLGLEDSQLLVISRQDCRTDPQVTKNWRHNSIALGNLPFFVDFFGISLFKDLHISYIMFDIYIYFFFYIHIYHTYLQFHGVILCKFWLQGLWQPFEVWLREAEGWNHRRDNDMFLLDRAYISKRWRKLSFQ